MEVGKPKRSRKKRNLRESSAKENQDLVPMVEVWKHILEDLLEVILTWLPILVLFRFRLVSKRWNSVISSIDFQQLWGKIAPKKLPWFFVKNGREGNGYLYDPLTNKWRHGPSIYLQPMDNSFPLTFSEGLVCYLNILRTSFHIGNPFTGRWREQPCTQSEIIKTKFNGSFSVGMVTATGKNSLTSPWRSKIVLLDYKGSYEIFTTAKDYSSEVHVITGKLPSHIQVPYYLNHRAINVGSSLTFLGSRPLCAIGYDVLIGKWLQVFLPEPLNSSDLSIIVYENGRILLTGLVKDVSTLNASVRVWKEDNMEISMWKEIDRMPSSMCSQFDGKDASYECLCNMHMVFILLKTSRMSRLFTYNVASREWSKVSKLDIPGAKRVRVSTGTCFYPSFSMP